MRHPRVLVLAAACLAAAVLWGRAGAAPQDVAVGAVRAVLSKTGAPLKERPIVLARASTTLPHAARVRILEVRGDWVRVRPVVMAGTDPETAPVGWLLANQTVEPFALTQAGRGGPVAVRDTPSQTDISAAGRQFDEVTERSYRATRADLEAQYATVDRIERTKPDPDAVRRFVLEGRLGRPREGGE